MLPLYMVSVLGSGFPVYTDFWLRPNFITYYYILLPLFYFIIEEEWDYLYLISIIGCTVSVMIIPCLFGGIFLLSLVLVYKNKIMPKHFIWRNILLLITCVFILLVFKLFAPLTNLVINHPFKELLFQSLTIWKAVVHSIVTLIIECSVLLFVAFLLNKFVIKNDKLKNVLSLILGQVVIGVILFQALNKLDNAYQFPYFAYAASGFILIVALLLFVNHLQNKFIKCSITVIVFFTSIYASYSSFDFNSLSSISLENKNLLQNNISSNWIKNASLYFKNNTTARGGFVLSKADLADFGPKSRSCITIQNGSFISYITDNCNLPSLTCKDTLLSDKNTENGAEFEKVEKWMEAFPLYTKECNVNEYLKDKKIDYLICSKNVLNIDTSIATIFSDEKSKYLLVIGK